MLYWIVFLFLEYMLLLTFTSSKKTGARTFFLFLIILLAVYFAGFRDCLGMDYDGYRENCERERYLGDTLWFLNEPIYEMIRNFCATTQFSAVVFFLVSAAFTSIPALIIYSKYENFALSGFVYLTYTGLYLFSFNIVRQFASAGILVLASYFLINDKHKGRILFVIFVVIAAMFHKSSLFFLPVMFLNRDTFNPILIAFLLVISYIVPFSNILGLGPVLEIFDMLDYDMYVDYSTIIIGKYSLTNLYLHLMLVPFLLNKKTVCAHKDKSMYVFAIKMYALCLICNNMSANGLAIAYRISILFSMYIPIVFSIINKVILDRVLSCALVIIPLLVLFFAIGMANPLVVPERMLPINSIWDTVYSNFK